MVSAIRRLDVKKKENVMSKFINGIKDPAGVIGYATITLRGPDGKIKDRSSNIVVTVGKYHIAAELADPGGQNSMSHMEIGTGTTPQDVADTTLETPLSRLPFDSKTQGTGTEANRVIYTTAWAPGVGTGIITEAGMFNASSGGTMMARTTFGAKDKGASDSLTITWTIIIT